MKGFNAPKTVAVVFRDKKFMETGSSGGDKRVKAAV
jgi:hypothetical protein